MIRRHISEKIMIKQEFKAESKKLLDLMINSIYTHKDIFLREIISNASDAIDKLIFMSLTDDRINTKREDFEIKITIDKEKRLLTVSDNGIGMNAEDMANNLGVIAGSGSQKFREALEAGAFKGGAQGKSETSVADLIGQFGVGFYSAFMVADRVTVISRKYGETQGFRWRSSGADGYEIAACGKPSFGTDVIMHIREDDFSRVMTEEQGAANTVNGARGAAGQGAAGQGAKIDPDDPDRDEYSRYLREYPIYKLVKKYSDYIRFPIKMLMPRPKVKEGSPKDAPEYEEEFVYETLNSMIPIWQRSKNEVTREEYDEFYQNHYDEKNKPQSVININVEGNVTYKALLFIPKKQSGQYDTDEYIPGLQLYSNGVKIMEHCMAIVPECYDFVRGIVDSPDLSLNISRETLQHDKQLRVIAGNIEKKIKAELIRMLTETREDYEKFFMNFGRRIKVCAMDNYGEKKEQLQELLMFFSSMTGKLITLSEYVTHMKPGQKYIYYASGHSFDAIDRLPQTEILKDNDIEILYFTDKADELVADMFGSYKEHLFRSCIDGDIDMEDILGTDGTQAGSSSSGTSGGGSGAAGTSSCVGSATDADKDYDCVFDFVKEALGCKVDEVKASTKLKSHPVCLSSGKGISFEMEKYFRAMQPNMPMKAKRILELNTSHPAFSALADAVIHDQPKARKYAEVLFNQACLIAGLPIPDPSGYTDIVCSLFE